MPRGEQVMSLAQLKGLAMAKRSVVGDPTPVKSPRPAAFIINMSGTTILRLLRHGLWVYEKGRRDVDKR